MHLRRSLLVLLLLVDTAPAKAAEWSRYSEFPFSIELPTGTFAVTEKSEQRLVLQDPESQAQIEVFGGINAEHLSVSEFREAVEAAATANRVVTYRAAGRSWFVLSGYMADDEATTDLIFYAKFMFDPAATSFSAFEISYPSASRASFEFNCRSA